MNKATSPATSSRPLTIHHSMMIRCYNSNHDHYHRYGGRGITVCPEWHDRHAFAAWAATSGYADDLTIDRIDNDKGYEPSNCRWATVAEQARNRSTNLLNWDKVNEIRKLYATGKFSQAELGRRFGVVRGTIHAVVHFKLWKP